jgi:MarR family transcriptional regulator, organic hydroperoxide resistance regulator
MGAVRKVAGDPDAVAGRRLGPVLEFMRALWAIDHQLQSASKRMESSLGVTGPQRMVLRIVGQHPGITAGEVAEILHLHPSTLTGILKRLGARRLVERRPDPADARRALLFLTTRGRGIDEVRAGTVEGAVRRALGRLSPRAVRDTREALEGIAAEIDMLG